MAKTVNNANENILSEFYTKTFNTLFNFDRELTRIDNATSCLEINTADIVPYILIPNKEEAIHQNNEFIIKGDVNENPLSVIKEMTDEFVPCLTKKKNEHWKIQYFDIKKLGNGFNTIKEEFFKGSQLVFKYDNEFYVIGRDAYITMLQRLGISCKFFNENPSIVRGQMIGYILSEYASAVKLIVREENGTKVIVAMNSDNFGYIPQSSILEAAKQINAVMKKAEFLKGTIDAEYTTCYIQFPEDSEKIKEQYKLPNTFVPGLRLQNSDCGRSSFIVAVTMNVIKGNTIGIAELASFSQQHTSKIDIDKLAKKSLKLFDYANQLPKIMCKLLQTDITAACVEDFVDTIAEQISLTKEVGKINGRKILDTIKTRSLLLSNRTAYDVVLEFLTIGDSTIISNPKAQLNFQKALGRITKIDFDVITSRFVVC